MSTWTLVKTASCKHTAHSFTEGIGGSRLNDSGRVQTIMLAPEVHFATAHVKQPASRSMAARGRAAYGSPRLEGVQSHNVVNVTCCLRCQLSYDRHDSEFRTEARHGSELDAACQNCAKHVAQHCIHGMTATLLPCKLCNDLILIVTVVQPAQTTQAKVTTAKVIVRMAWCLPL